MSFAITLTRLSKLLQILHSLHLTRALLFNRVLAGAEHRHVINPELLTVADVGANRGQFSLAVRCWAPKANIIAFEPLSNAAAKYRKIFRKDSAVTLHQAAIGSEHGNAIINIAAEDDSSSLLPISPLQERIFPGTKKIGVEKVKIERLSTFIPFKKIVSPALLKLDVQGYELQALQGCESLLHCFEYVYVECSFTELYEGQALADEIIAWLRERSFVLKGIYNLYYDANGAPIQGDFLFLKYGLN